MKNYLVCFCFIQLIYDVFYFLQQDVYIILDKFNFYFPRPPISLTDRQKLSLRDAEVNLRRKSAFKRVLILFKRVKLVFKLV